MEQIQNYETQRRNEVPGNKKKVDLNVLLSELKTKKKHYNKMRLLLLVSSISVAILFFLFLKL